MLAFSAVVVHTTPPLPGDDCLLDQLMTLASTNLSSPVVLFFALGVAAAFLRSDLTVPEAFAKGLTMVQTFPRKKLEIIVEAAILPRVEELLVRVGAKGYTVLEGAKGFGAQGVWSDDTLLHADRMLIVDAILTEERGA